MRGEVVHVVLLDGAGAYEAGAGVAGGDGPVGAPGPVVTIRRFPEVPSQRVFHAFPRGVWEGLMMLDQGGFVRLRRVSGRPGPLLTEG